MRRKSSRTASASASNTASTTTRCSTPRWRASTGTKRNRAGSSAPTAAMPSPRSSSAWAPGPLHVPKLPGIPGIESFKGHSFHTSRWDYDYTGGDPSRRADGQAGGQARRDHRHRRNGRAVRAASRARLQGALRLPAHAVFGRCPRQRADRSGMVFRDRDARLAAALARELHREPGRRQCRRKIWCRTAGPICRAGSASKIMQLPREQRTPPNMLAAFEDSDYEKMEEIRARVDTIVGDRETAAKLKAWYRQLCKRPCFHDEYLQAFNVPGTHLVDTDGKGVERITENGVVVAGREYKLDCIIYASGFEVGTEYQPALRLRSDRPRRRQTVGVLGRGHAHQARHPCARLPERLLRAADAGRQSHLQRAAQSDRGRKDHRHDGQACAGQRLQGDRSDARKPRIAGSSCC